MWRHLWSLLSAIGGLRVTWRRSRVPLTVGSPTERDALDSTYWMEYADTERLFAVWGPVSGGPWEPYHCVPLFAALQAVDPANVGPTHPEQVRQVEGNGHLDGAVSASPLRAEWVAQGSWVILDLPGATSVAAAVRLIASGFQPVCTFDNWPHPAGLIKAEIVLAQLLRYAAVVVDARRILTEDSPPLWVCDRDRLGTRPGRPREFDNRYYLDDSVLPSADTLRRNGVERIVCVVPGAGDRPREDLCAYFRDLRKLGFNAIRGVAFSDPGLAPFDFPEEVFSISFTQSGFRRTDAGGFGVLIPQPSSSGG